VVLPVVADLAVAGAKSLVAPAAVGGLAAVTVVYPVWVVAAGRDLVDVTAVQAAQRSFSQFAGMSVNSQVRRIDPGKVVHASSMRKHLVRRGVYMDTGH
jgi:hypothetical protein